MNLSHYCNSLLFESFFTLFRIASCSTLLSMCIETVQKRVKKSPKNQYVKIVR